MATSHGGPAGRRAEFAVRAVDGPPRPALVLEVGGEIDRSNDAELVDQVRRAVALTRTTPGGLPRDRFGCRSLDRAVVVDLRGVSFIGARALGLLAAERGADGRAVRLVVDRDGVIRRALAVVRPPSGCHVHADLADAVLGEVDPRAHAPDR